jgi:hypothetical protein
MINHNASDVKNKSGTDRLDRTILPIPEPQYPPITELDARKATPPPRFEVKAPKGEHRKGVKDL